MKKLKKLFSGNSLLLTSIVLLLLLIVFFGVSYVTETPATIKDLRVTNISDTSVTVTYFTEVPTYGSVIVSDKNDFDFLNQLSKTRYYDDRKDGELRYSHHITVSGLKPSSAYFFEVMGNLKNVKYTYPVLQTGKTLDTLVTPDPTYGSFSDNTSMDSIVYLSLDGSTLQSTYLGTGNTFSMDKANIRTPDLEDQAKYKYHDPILIEILNKDTQLGYQTNVGSDQPTAKFETTTNKEPSKIKLNTSVLGSVYAEAACSAATLTLGEKTTCTGPNGYQYVVIDGKFDDSVARMQDYTIKTGIAGSTIFTEDAKKQAEKGGDKGPYSPTNPAPIPVNAGLPLCSDKTKIDESCRGVQNGFTYTKKSATEWNDTTAKEQNADRSKLYDPTLTAEQEALTTAEKAKVEAEHKSLCAQLTVNKVVWTKKDDNTLFNCKDGTYTEYKCGIGEVVLPQEPGKDDKCGKVDEKLLCKNLASTITVPGVVFKSNENGTEINKVVAGCPGTTLEFYYRDGKLTDTFLNSITDVKGTECLDNETGNKRVLNNGKGVTDTKGVCQSTPYKYKNSGNCVWVAESCTPPAATEGSKRQPDSNLVTKPAVGKEVREKCTDGKYVGDIIKAENGIENIVTDCAGEGNKSTNHFFKDSREKVNSDLFTKYSTDKEYKKCDTNLNSKICNFVGFTLLSDTSCNNIIFATDCKVDPSIDGAGAAKPPVVPAGGLISGYYNLIPKPKGDLSARTFDTNVITKSCGAGQIPDTIQNGGQLTFNTDPNDGAIYGCEGNEQGSGTIVVKDKLKNLATIHIGIVNKEGKLEIVSNNVPAGTILASPSTNIETKETPKSPTDRKLVLEKLYSKICTSWNDESKSCCKEITVKNIQTFDKGDPLIYTKAIITASCNGNVIAPNVGYNCGKYADGEPYCANNGKTEFGLGRCVKGIPHIEEGLCNPEVPNKTMMKELISPVNAEAVLGVSDSSGVELNSTGTYSITSGNTSIKEFKVMDLVNGKAKIVFFDDKNANGIRDTGEEDITTPVEVKIEKTSDISRFELNEGWNLVGYEYTEARTAKDLLSNISSNGGYATHVATYRQGGWVMYSERAEKSFGNNFNLVPGEGYFVKVIKSGKLSFEGNKIAANQPYRLSNGWNLLSFRLDPVLKASKLIDAINLNTPVSSDVVTRYVSGKYENVVKDKDTVYGNDFDVEENKGYFVRAIKGGVVVKF